MELCFSCNGSGIKELGEICSVCNGSGSIKDFSLSDLSLNIINELSRNYGSQKMEYLCNNVNSNAISVEVEIIQLRTEIKELKKLCAKIILSSTKYEGLRENGINLINNEPFTIDIDPITYTPIVRFDGLTIEQLSVKNIIT